MPYHQFNDMRVLCLEHLAKGRARPNSCHIADLVATMLQATCVVLDQERFFFECFDGGFWTVRHKDALESKTHGSLMALTKSVFGETSIPPEPINDVHFCASLIPAVLGRLSGCVAAPLDGEHSRMKLLCADGVIVDFLTKERRKARPGDRMCLRAAASSEAWCPPRPTQLFEQIKEYLLSGETELHDSELGRRVEESFRQLEADGCELLGVLRPYGAWDHVLFVLRMFTRAVVGASRFCEMFYVYGLGHSGKDVLFLILTAFLGTLPFQYSAMLPGTYLTAMGRP